MHTARVALIAAAISHMEGFFNTGTLANRNRNPGNITKWGDMPMNGRFAVFPSAIDGFDALCKDIEANVGKVTLAQFIARYAPPNENNTSAYLTYVSHVTGILTSELL